MDCGECESWLHLQTCTFFLFLSFHTCLTLVTVSVSVSGYGHGESWAMPPPPPPPIPSVCPSLSMYKCNSETPCLSRSSRALLNVCVGWLVGLQVPVVAPLPPSLSPVFGCGIWVCLILKPPCPRPPSSPSLHSVCRSV